MLSSQGHVAYCSTGDNWIKYNIGEDWRLRVIGRLFGVFIIRHFVVKILLLRNNNH